MAHRKPQVGYRRPAGTGDLWIGKYVREHYPAIAREAEQAGIQAMKERGHKMQAGLKSYRIEKTEAKLQKLQDKLRELKGEPVSV